MLPPRAPCIGELLVCPEFTYSRSIGTFPERPAREKIRARNDVVRRAEVMSGVAALSGLPGRAANTKFTETTRMAVSPALLRCAKAVSWQVRGYGRLRGGGTQFTPHGDAA